MSRQPVASHVSRRRAIQGVATAAALPLIPATSFIVRPLHAETMTLPTFNIPDQVFSAAERDRRWAAVRAIMARPSWNLDAIITAVSDSDGNYARYLTQIGNRPGSGDGPEVIFSRDAAQPVYVQVGSGRNRDMWKERLTGWTGDNKLEISSDGGAEKLAEQLTARGFKHDGARIGVARLAGSRFDPDGLVSQTYMEKLRGALPGVQWVAIDKWGTDPGPVEESAMIKSSEEQAVVRQGVAASEAGLAAMIAAIRGGAQRQADIWFAAYTAMFAQTGEDPTRLSIAFDRGANSTLGMAVADPLKPGQIINQEIDGTAQGYRAQVNHAVFVGSSSTPGYDYYRRAMDIMIALLNEAPKAIQPGKTTLDEFAKWYMARVEAAGAEDSSGVMLHSSGIGNLSRPRIGPSNSTKDLPIVIRPGMTFDFKPQIRLKRETMSDAGARNRDVQIGEHFLVTETGVQRLGKRDLVPITTQT
jgi:Xaa-Pro aminopeptidase